MSANSDTRLVNGQRSTNGEFETFLRNVAPDLLSYFTRRVHPVDGAADCLSEVLLVLWRQKESIPKDSEGRRAWAFGVANKILSAHYRASSRRIALTERLRSELLVAAPVEQDLSPTLIDALASLKLQDRELVLLVAWEGFSLVEVAGILQIRQETARARYSRARAKLRKIYDRQ